MAAEQEAERGRLRRLRRIRTTQKSRQEVLALITHKNGWGYGCEEAEVEEAVKRTIEEEEGTQAFNDKLEQELNFLADITTVCNKVMELQKMLLPKDVTFRTKGKEYKFQLKELDSTGHAVYTHKEKAKRGPSRRGSLVYAGPAGPAEPQAECRIGVEAHQDSLTPLLQEHSAPLEHCLRWKASDGEQPGRWVFSEVPEHNPEEKYFMQSIFVTDPGTWEKDNGDRVGVHVVRQGKRVVDAATLRMLRECFTRRAGRGNPEVDLTGIVEQVRSTAAGVFKNGELLTLACELAEAMCNVCYELGFEGWTPLGVNRSVKDLFDCLLSLAGCAQESLSETLKSRLEPYEGLSSQPWAHCLRTNRRLLSISDLHDSEESYLPRILHRLCFWKWQDTCRRDQPDGLELEIPPGSESPASRGSTPGTSTPRLTYTPARIRKVQFVVISDTHGWDGDLQLPEGEVGEVLLHCGNLLFESTTMSPDPHRELPRELKDLEPLFKLHYKQFKQIVIVGGSHDGALFHLWLHNPKKLLELLPENVVFLQDARLRELYEVPPPKDQGSGPRWRAMCEGVVLLKPLPSGMGEDARPAETDMWGSPADGGGGQERGFVVAGTGVSLARENSPRRAFQLYRSDAEKAAKWLVERRKPDILLTHGPPRTANLPMGDEELAKALSSGWPEATNLPMGDEEPAKALSSGWPKVVVFGGVQELHGRVQHDQENSTLVSAALAGPLFVPRRPPITFGLETPQTQYSGLNRQGFSDVMLGIQNRLTSTRRPSCIPWLFAETSAVPKEAQDSGASSNCCSPAFLEAAGQWLCMTLRSCFWGKDDLVWGWIPRSFIEEQVLNDVIVRKYRTAVTDALKKAKETGSETHLICTWTSEDGRLPREGRWKAIQEMAESKRKELEVPREVWDGEYVFAKNETPHEFLTYELKSEGESRRLSFEETLPEGSFKVEVRFPLKDRIKLSDFDVAGPVVLHAQQALIHWLAAPMLTLAAFIKTPKPKEGETFAVYPLWLWALFLPMFIHMWIISKKCFKYMVVPQVHQLGRGFKVVWAVSFHCFMWLMGGFSLLTLMDITAQCFFYGQFLRSVKAEDSPVPEVWRETIGQAYLVSYIPGFANIVHLFTFCWACMFVQFLYMLFHMFPTSDSGIDYTMGRGDTFGSMPQGYTVIASRLFPLELKTGEEQVEAEEKKTWCKWFWQWVKGELRFPLWHADIIRVLAIYGRMPILTWTETDLMKIRLDQELKKKSIQRFFQIMFLRLKEFQSRLLLVDILEKAFKLEIQVSIFAIDRMIQKQQNCGEASVNKQMLFAIALSLFSAVYAFYCHVSTCKLLWTLTRTCQKTYIEQDSHYLNRKGNTRSMNYVEIFLRIYTVCILGYFLFVFHSAVKLVAAFTCSNSLWDIKWDHYGCVEELNITSISISKCR